MKKIAFVLALIATPVFAAKPIIGADTPAKPAPAPAPAPAPEVPIPAEPDTPEKAINRFFAYLQRREVDQAYDQLTRGTKIAERAEDVKLLKSKTKDAIAVYGAIQGFETVASKKVGERLLRQTVVSLGKEFPLRWRFYFYKLGESWRLIDMRVDDRLSAIFDELEEVPKADRP
jgi:hypothetical protein